MPNLRNHAPQHARYLGLEGLPGHMVFAIYRKAIEAQRWFHVIQRADKEDGTGLLQRVGTFVKRNDVVSLISHAQKAIMALEAYRTERDKIPGFATPDFSEADPLQCAIEVISKELDRASVIRDTGARKLSEGAPPKRAEAYMLDVMVKIYELTFGRPMPQSQKTDRWLEAWYAQFNMPAPTEHQIKASRKRAANRG